MRFATCCAALGGDDRRGGSCGLDSGWSSVIGNVDLERRLSSSSMSRMEASIAAFNSGSCSSAAADEVATFPAGCALPRCGEDGAEGARSGSHRLIEKF